MNRAENGDPIPYLLEGWDLDRDALTLTMYMKEGIKFHDGTPFNAEAAIWCMQNLIDSGQPELPNVGSLEALDEYTIRVNMAVWDILMVNYFMLKGGNMYSPTAVQENGQEWAVLHPVSTGPFKFVSIQKDVSLKYTRNDDYWREGRPYLDAIEFIFIQDIMTRVAAFKAGEGHVITGLTALQAHELEETGDYVITKANFSIFTLYMDSVNEDSPWGNVLVRKAASYAINREEICEAFGYGFLEPTDQIGFPGYAQYDPNLQGYPYNPDKARELLADAGYPDGFDTTIWYTAGNNDNIFQAVQGYWADVGINAELEIVQSGAALEIATGGWHNGVQSIPGVFVALGYPAAKSVTFTFSPMSVFAVSVIRPDDVEELRIQSLSADTVEEMNTLLREINRLLIDEYCVCIPIFVSPDIAAKVPYVHNDRILDGWQEQWYPADAWLEHE